MNKPNEDFYVLKYKNEPGNYDQDSQWGSTEYVLLADRYESPTEALKYVPNDMFNVCKVHIEVQRV